MTTTATMPAITHVAHGGVTDAGYGPGLSFRDPDNIALELFAAPGS